MTELPGRSTCVRSGSHVFISKRPLASDRDVCNPELAQCLCAQQVVVMFCIKVRW